MARVCEEVVTEWKRAVLKFGAFHSGHEGYAVLLEEVRELEREVFWGTRERQREEAIQVAAMAMRFIADVCDRPAEEGKGGQ